MKNAFDDPKRLSMILREQERSAVASIGLETLAAQRSAAGSIGLETLAAKRSAAASIGLETLAAQRSAAASIGLETLAAKRSAAASIGLETLAPQRSAAVSIGLEALAPQRSAAVSIGLEALAARRSAVASIAVDTLAAQRPGITGLASHMLAEHRAGISDIAANMFAVKSAGTSVYISDALSAAKLANTSLSQMIQGASATFDRKRLPGGVLKDWLREMALASNERLAATTGMAFKSHLINIASISSQAEVAVSSLLPDRLGLALSISDEAKSALTGSFCRFLAVLPETLAVSRDIPSEYAVF
ncbi:MAG: hypothetical protein ACR2HX_05395 [Pyrinomonadaceae bacterium]